MSGTPSYSPFFTRPTTDDLYNPYKTDSPSISTSARRKGEKKSKFELREREKEKVEQPDPEDIFLRHAHRGNQLANKTCPCPVLSPLSSYTYTSASVGGTRGVGFPAETFESITKVHTGRSSRSEAVLDFSVAIGWLG